LAHESRYASRESKAKKISAILQDFLGPDLSKFNCLDVGCSSGGITNNLANQFRTIVGIDIDRVAVVEAQSISKKSSTQYALASGSSIPFKDSSFDVVICAQVYEHTKEQTALTEEILRILHPGGVCFFSGPNRLAVMEEHYWLPFLSWLPRPIANLYMKALQRGNEYDAYPLFYWQIRRLWNGFTIHDYTIKMIHHPNRFAVNNKLSNHSWVKNIPARFLSVLSPFFPNYNWILKKST
jgi:ubiquinone/menaquinone biosynthesis C-methylase UbiE